MQNNDNYQGSIIENYNAFHSFINFFRNIIIILSPQFNIIDINNGAEEIYGVTRDDVLGKNYLDLFLPSDTRDFVAKDIRKVLAGQPTLSFENEILTKNKTKTINWSVNRITDYKGRPVAIVASGQDVTNRKAMENRLKNSEKRFRAISQVLGHGVYVLDKNKKLMYINDEGERLLGWKKEELIGKQPHPVFHYKKIDGSPYPAEECPIIQVVDSGKSFETDNEAFVKKDGTIFPVAYTATPLVEDGRVTGSVNVFEDISERKAVQQKIIGEREFTTALLKGLTEGFVAMDKHGKIILVNDALCSMTGFLEEELVGSSPPYKYWPEESYGKIERIQQEVLNGAEGEHELIFTRKNGDRFVALTSPRKINDPDGNPLYISTIKDITKRKQAEQELARFKFFLDSANEDFYLVKSDGTLAYVNKAVANSLGYSIDELHNMKIQDIDLIFDDVVMKKHFNNLREKKTLPPLETVQITKNGRKIKKEITTSYLQIGDEEYSCAFGRDITERKQDEDALKESEERYRKLIELANDAIFIADADSGILIGANKKASEMLGVPVGDIIGMHQSELHPKEEAERYREIFIDAVRTGSVVTEELFVVRKDGRRVPVEISANITEVAGRKIAQGIFRDITERKAAEERLRLFSTAVEGAADGIQLTDMEGNLLFSNRSIERIFGYSPGEDRFVGEMNVDPDFAGKVIIPTLKQKGHWAGEVLVKHSDGHTFPIYLSTSVVTDDQGRPIALLGVIRDITAQKQTERQQRRAKELSDALNDINASVKTTLDINEILRQVVAKARKAIGSESAGIALREEESWHIKYSCKLPSGLVGKFLTDNQARLALLAAQSGEAIVSNDSFNDPRVNASLMTDHQIRSFIAVPLTIRDEVLGVLYFFNHSGPVNFDNMQLDYANKLASSISLSIENARLYQTERNIANTLQKSILSVPEKLPGIDFAYLYRSATETAMVGGDFYDLFELEGGKIGVIIGDVSGKGLDAATLTSLIKNTLKAYAYSDLNVGEILSKTNNVITKNSAPTIFATVFIAILDTVSGILTYSSAGHPPPIFKNGEGIRFLENGNTAIGVFMNQHYDVRQHLIQKGDLLVLYTDGVIEARKGKELFGDVRLLDTITTLHARQAHRIPKIIYDVINGFTGGKLVDDIAIVSLTLK